MPPSTPSLENPCHDDREFAMRASRPSPDANLAGPRQPTASLARSSSDAGPRKYPPPPSGHELMAMFPPPPPNLSESSSHYFHRQERAYFAQKGNEIIRVQAELDRKDSSMMVDEARIEQKPIRTTNSGFEAWHSSPTHPRSPFEVPAAFSSSQVPFGSHPRPSAVGPPVPIQLDSSYRPSSHYSLPPLSARHSLTPASHHSSSASASRRCDGLDCPEEASQRPLSRPERRRPANHTKRSIVKV
ncbi:hypothetical protein JAAARDRAFT_54442 [Jaapia argillacea MUCL 33604]|uniref:Uncharacterized protein n=1 Tax=Jaapia argillacea MUCL 33604 TaxID=933084 RepID=A0A067QIS4_9AGAM|nr:hypothetical protein JAAARDRAFT_54442 [Jaapia argillacea MUCL 33604]